MIWGGMGTYDLAIRHPDLFAAAIPICGTVNPARFTPALKQVKFRIFHGDADNVVPVEGSRAAYRALKELGVDVKYTEVHRIPRMYARKLESCFQPSRLHELAVRTKKVR